MPSRPLPNRVDPFGELRATPSRGSLMGNRGGRFHTDDQTLSRRRWTSRLWIVCLCEFKQRHREVWGRGYTELFFLDEPTAFSAGHRPCFECRRAEALAFRAAFPSSRPLSAPEMDEKLHAERLDGSRKRTHMAALDGLPDGTMIARGASAFAVRGETLLPWSFAGYGAPLPRPRGDAEVLTPPSIVAGLANGYAPRWAELAY